MNGQISMSGITGVKNFGVKDLNYRFIFLASNIVKKNIWLNRDDKDFNDISLSERDFIRKFSAIPNILEEFTSLIAPTIWGCRDIKKGILLMMFGGVHKETSSKMKLRGDINLCVIGDPSTAKSQFLKFVHAHIPRCIYANGKGTTAAGLTASVSRDIETNEFGIEAGALIMADNGICCIDEFDKIEEADVAAIHEAMEQQTISITKAGIQATLNSRTAILAALNPRYGRYDKSKSLKMNINMAPPLLSRFDIVFVITDEFDEARDGQVARQIMQNHKTFATNYLEYVQDKEDSNTVMSRMDLPGSLTPNNLHNTTPLINTPINTINSNLQNNVCLNVNGINKNQPPRIRTQQMSSMLITLPNLLRYLRIARKKNPRIMKEAAELIVKAYLEIRDYAAMGRNNTCNITVRQLESLIRMSEAVARVYMSDVVSVEHVHEATELLKNSIFQNKGENIMLETQQLEEIGPEPEVFAENEKQSSVHESMQLIQKAEPSFHGAYEKPMEEYSGAQKEIYNANATPNSEDLRYETDKDGYCKSQSGRVFGSSQSPVSKPKSVISEGVSKKNRKKKTKTIKKKGIKSKGKSKKLSQAKQEVMNKSKHDMNSVSEVSNNFTSIQKMPLFQKKEKKNLVLTKEEFGKMADLILENLGQHHRGLAMNNLIDMCMLSGENCFPRKLKPDQQKVTLLAVIKKMLSESMGVILLSEKDGPNAIIGLHPNNE